MGAFFEKFLFKKEEGIENGSGGTPEKKLKEIIEGQEKNLDEILKKVNEIIKNPENKKIIDRLFDEKYSTDLSEKLIISRDLLEKTGLLNRAYSNGKEIVRSIKNGLDVWFRKIREKGERDDYIEMISYNISKLKDFIDLTLECDDFREKEFGTEEGFLPSEDNEKSGATLRLKWDEYIEKCKENINKRSN